MHGVNQQVLGVRPHRSEPPGRAIPSTAHVQVGGATVGVGPQAAALAFRETGKVSGTASMDLSVQAAAKEQPRQD